MKKITLLILSCFILFSAGKSNAQLYPQWYSMSHDEIIWDIAFDHDIAWIATRGGLVKFDRITGVKTFYNAANSPLYQNEIKDVEVDDSGSVWIGSYYGDLTKFDGTNWTHYWSLNGADSLFGIHEMHKDRNGNIIISPTVYYGYGMVKYDGINFTDLSCPVSQPLCFDIDTMNNLWCGFYSKLLKYDGTVWTQYDSTNSPFTACIINSVCADRNNNVWINVYETTVPHDNKIYRLSNSTWTYIPPAMSGIPLNDMCQIKGDENGNVYFFGNHNGLTKFDGANFINYSLSSFGINASDVYRLTTDSASHLWMMPNIDSDTILYEYDGMNLLTHFTSNSPLLSATSNSITIDHEGNRWFCPGYKGLQKFDGFNWTNYNRNNSDINSNILASVTADNNNNIWVGTQGDSAFLFPVAKFDGSIWTTYPLTFFGSGTFNIKQIVVDRLNNVWFCVMGHGVAKYDGSSWSYWDSSNVGLGMFFCTGIAADTNNYLWATAYGNGLFRFAGGTWTKYTTLNSAIPSDYISSVFADHNNNIWITSDSGLTKFDGITFTNYGGYNANVQGTPYKVSADDGINIWICTDRGVTKFDGTNWTNYNKYNSGLGELQVWDIKVDKNNTKWISAFDGLWVFNENGIDPSYWHNVPDIKFEGKVFYDLNSNGMCDSLTEPGMINQKIICTTDSSSSYSNSLGIYRFYKDPGNYESAYIPYANWNITSDSVLYHITLDTVSIPGFDYGAYPVNPYGALEINLTAGSMRCNALSPFWIAYQNTGTTLSAGTVTFIKHDSLQVLNSIPPPDAANGDTMLWNYSGLMPFEQRMITLNVQNPDVNSIDDTLKSFIAISDTAGITNSDSVAQIISCSWDPNNKSVEPAGLTPVHYVFMGDSLEYTINFQNMGSDTAFSVVIIDSVPAAMQKESFVFLAGSHPVDIEISQSGVIRFLFDNILLPPQKTNEHASMGYVKYRLKPQPGTLINTQVTNTAFIYFDFNPSIATNTVSNVYVNTIPGIRPGQPVLSLKIFPNPFGSELHIVTGSMKEPTSFIKINDLTGRPIFYRKINSGEFILNTNHFDSGVYIAEIINGTEIRRVKVIKY